MAKARLDSWVVSDTFCGHVEPLVPRRTPRAARRKFVRKPGGGCKPKDARLVFEAIVYVLRTGCQWKALPRERFGSAGAIHKRFLEWEKAGFFITLWQVGLAEYGEMEGIAWRWQSIDGTMVKAPLAQESVEPNPTDRGKNGSKRMLLVDERGAPLSIVVTGAISEREVEIKKTLADANAVQTAAQLLKQQYENRMIDWEHEKAHGRIQMLEEIDAERARMMAALKIALEQERKKRAGSNSGTPWNCDTRWRRPRSPRADSLSRAC